MIKKLLLLLVLIASITGSFAQGNVHLLSDNEFNDIVYKNVKSGKHEFFGLNDQYSFSVTHISEEKVSDEFLISNIKRMNDVLDCYIDHKQLLVVVRFKMPNTKAFYLNDQHVEEVKKFLDLQGIRVTNYYRQCYTSK